MRDIYIVIASVVGLMIGSFLNVVIYRLPRGESVVSPPSACPKCGHRLSPWENIPVLSYLILKGKCRNCKEKISPRYLLVEVLTAVGFGVMFYHFSDVITALSFSIFVAFLVSLSFIDLDTRKLPRQIIYVAMVPSVALLGVPALLRHDWGTLSGMGIGAAIGLGTLGLIHLLAPRSMGMGDVRFAGYLGFNLGYLTLYAVVDLLYGSFLLGAIFGVVFAILKSKSLKVSLPFGPFLSIAAFAAAIIGNSLHIL